MRLQGIEYIFVSKQEVLYVSDCVNDRILRFAEGTSAPTVVAYFADRDGVNPWVGSL